MTLRIRNAPGYREFLVEWESKEFILGDFLEFLSTRDLEFSPLGDNKGVVGAVGLTEDDRCAVRGFLMAHPSTTEGCVHSLETPKRRVKNAK